MVVRSARTSVATIPLGLLVLVLAAWSAFAPLVGPYFGFALETDDAWSFTREYWLLGFAPGIVAFAGGLAMLVPLRRAAWLGGLLALLGGAWLLIGPSLYPVFSTGEVDPLAASEWRTALLWIGYFYGVGVLIVLFAALGQGLAWRRPAVVIREEAAAEPPLAEAVPSRTVVYPL